jgi:hypothetical protein
VDSQNPKLLANVYHDFYKTKMCPHYINVKTKTNEEMMIYNRENV